MSRTQQYLANAQDCAERGVAAGDSADRQSLALAEQAWRVLAGIEADKPAAAPTAPSPAAANRQGFRAGWYTG